MNLLAAEEMSVSLLVDVLGIPQPTASRHLKLLRDAGLVQQRKDGLWCYYSLSDGKGGFHSQLIGCLGSCFNDVPELRGDLRKLRRVTGKKSLAIAECGPGEC